MLDNWRLTPWLVLAAVGAACAGSDSAALRPRHLEVGRPIRAEFAGGERHTYRFTLKEGESARVLVDQHATDLAAVVHIAGGPAVERIDMRERGIETVAVVAAAGGQIDIAIETVESPSSRAVYDVTLESRHPTGPDDLARVEAQRLSTETKRLADDPSAGVQQRALELLPRVIRLWNRLGDRALEADALSRMGDVLHGRSEFAEAEASYLHALALTRQLGDRREEATILNNLGLGCWRRGLLNEASEYFRQALEGWRALPFPYGEAATLTNEGLLFRESGDYREALERHTQALEIFQELGNRAAEAYALNNIAVAHRALGDDVAALSYMGRALAGFREAGDVLAEGRALVRLGQIYLARGDAGTAAPNAHQALAVIQPTGNRSAQADALDLLGQVAESSGDVVAALEHYSAALERYRAAGSRRGEASALHRLGRTHAANGDHAAAMESLRVALGIRRDVGLRDAEAETLHEIGLLQSRQGRLSAARTDLRAALAIAEDVRFRVAGEHSRTAYLAARMRYYTFYIDLVMQLHARNPRGGFAAEAFDVAERARARTLLDLLGESGVEIRRGADPTLLARERELRRQIDFWANRLARLADQVDAGEARAGVRQNLASLLVDLRETDARIRASASPDVALAPARTLSVRDIQRHLLDRDSVLLRFALGEERSHAWIVTRTSFRAIALPGRAEIEEAARAVYESVSARRSVHDADRLLQQHRLAAATLSELLLRPLAAELGAKRLLVVGEGLLEVVPFAALPDPRSHRLLAETHEIVMLPSASMLAVLRQERARRAPAPRTLAMFADPVYEAADPRVSGTSRDARPASARAERPVDAPLIPWTRLMFSRLEADAILSLVAPDERLEAIGFAANRGAATAREISDYRIVHFAAHAIHDSAHPELSGIVLSLVDPDGAPADGFLRLHDIYRSSFRADLIVLSACQTALGRNIPGEGVVGLARGFFHAGATRVVASLYKVDDEATAEFMRLFYEAMLGTERTTAAAALRVAQRGMMAQQRWRDPYWWSAFVLIGEPV